MIGELSLTKAQLRSFRRALLGWYDQNRRELPWRRDRNSRSPTRASLALRGGGHPYRVWVSEIMLQQTRVAAVLDHYARFMRRFPTVQALAAAREASVLALWSGLGYYHRARRMHQAAKLIVRRGSFPQTAQEWAELPGIGRYTAAAIASIAFDEPVAVVDGNVERVLQRLFPSPRLVPGNFSPESPRSSDKGKQFADVEDSAATRRNGLSPGCKPRVRDPKKAEPRSGETWQQAEALLDRRRPGDFNQAMMELGAMICTPRAPHCLICPVNSFCQTQGEEKREPARARKSRELNYALARKNDSVLLVQRSADASLMAGMWELPSLTAEQVNGDAPLLSVRHSITDTDYRVSVYSLSADQLQKSAAEAKWFAAKQWQRLPLTGLARKILRRIALHLGGE